MRISPARHRFRVSPFSKVALGLVMLLLWAPVAASADPSTPSKVSARYKVLFNGFDIGSFRFESSVDSANYSLTGRGKISALLGVLKWSGATQSSGALM